MSLDTDVTPALAAEGLARDLVREVQSARRDADLDVSDRITLTLHADAELRSTLEPFADYVASQVLATEVVWADAPQPVTATLADATMTVGVARVED